VWLPGGRRGQVTLLACIVLLLALPTAVVDTQASQHLYTVPPEFDRFLSAVRAATPPSARVLILDPYTDPHHHLILRSRYDLYPRRVYYQPVPARFVRKGVLTMRWSDVLRRARRHTDYAITWALPVASPGHVVADLWGWALPTPLRGPLIGAIVRLRNGWGTLVQVER
jgi:hypothetical protein